MEIVIGLILLICVYVLAILYLRRLDSEIHWDWKTIDTDDLHFPDNFLWGTAMAAYQVEGGCTNNNWNEWERATDSDGRPRIRNGAVVGAACDHWNRYEDDIRLIKDLGLKAYRFSLEWSKIEPAEGQFDQAVLKHYSNVIDAILKAGIEPMITLYHFTHPIWFRQLGAFEKIENIDHFQRFCERVFNEYSDRVPKWCTINEIEVEATQSYFTGDWPPGEQDGQIMGKVMRHLLEAHVRVYRALKSLPNGEKVQIGLVKNIFQFDPWRPWHLIDQICCRLLNRVFNGGIIEFFKTGRFRLFIPGLVNVTHVNRFAISANDFIGLNYYSHLVVKFKWDPQDFFQFRLRPRETPTDMDYTIYPEGFYRALKQIGKLGLPIYVTENGIADHRDDRREHYIRRYLYALSKAIVTGSDVRGYFYWSLLDNFEWSEGYSMKFGLYKVDFESQKRVLRDGAVAYREIITRHG
ncbi:MAG: family 1 glycosylhydrolase [Candidatus Marinimicrobia bacterium]|nr:family 1 glycosylhydrolase [Candidatus Neomarinimicrobiota bacterium]